MDFFWLLWVFSVVVALLVYVLFVLFLHSFYFSWLVQVGVDLFVFVHFLFHGFILGVLCSTHSVFDLKLFLKPISEHVVDHWQRHRLVVEFPVQGFVYFWLRKLQLRAPWVFGLNIMKLCTFGVKWWCWLPDSCRCGTWKLVSRCIYSLENWLMFDKSIRQTPIVPGGMYILDLKGSVFLKFSILVRWRLSKSNILGYNLVLPPVHLKLTISKFLKLLFCNGFRDVKAPWVEIYSSSNMGASIHPRCSKLDSTFSIIWRTLRYGKLMPSRQLSILCWSP